MRSDSEEQRLQSQKDTLFMKWQTRFLPPKTSQNPGTRPSKPAFNAANIARLTSPRQPRVSVRSQAGPSAWALEADDSSFVYVVDDEPRLTDLYSIILENTGYVVRTFNNRLDALASLKGEGKKPDLLIMDYLGHAMPVDQFMQRCLLAHPALRILMATGFSQMDARFSNIRPDGFLQKPFTAEEFLREVKAALGV